MLFSTRPKVRIKLDHNGSYAVIDVAVISLLRAPLTS